MSAMRANHIRAALTDSGWNGQGPDECPACGRELPGHHPDCAIGPEAWAQLEAMERVVEAARALVKPPSYATMGNAQYVNLHPLRAALAELDGQTPRGGASGNEGTAGIATPDGCAERQSRPDVPRGVCSCPAGSYNPGCHEDYCPLATEDAQ